MQEKPFEPVIGQWYLDRDNRIFEVVASDEESIDIQFYDGDVEEVDREIWDELAVTTIAEPNDGIGPFDELDDESNILAEDYRPSPEWS